MPTIPGGLWIKEHCLEITPNKTTGGVRYRYPGQDWILVEGGDSFTRGLSLSCEVHTLNIYVQDNYTSHNGREHICDRMTDGRPRKTLFYPESHPLLNFEVRVKQWVTLDLGILQFKIFNSTYPNGSSWQRVYSGYCSRIKPSDFTSGKITFEAFNNNNPDQNCSSHVLNIFKGEKLLEQVKSDVFLEAEIVEGTCTKDKPTQVAVTTAPLGFIAILPREVNNGGITTGEIPSECVNVYTAAPTISLGSLQTIDNTGTNYTFIGQYCSSPDCDLPTVERSGDKCGRACHPDTCPVLCGDSVCCYYQETGIAVTEIPLSEYIGGDL